MEFRPTIQWMEIERVIPYVKNSIDHPQDQIDDLARSISTFGFDQPIVCDREWVIVKGHARLEAAKQLGMKMVPVIQVSHLDEYETIAARIADNKVREKGRWKLEVLKFEVQTLISNGRDTKLTAIPEKELKRLAAPPPMKSDQPPEERSQFIVTIYCKDEPDMRDLYEEMKERGFECKLIT